MFYQNMMKLYSKKIFSFEKNRRIFLHRQYSILKYEINKMIKLGSSAFERNSKFYTILNQIQQDTSTEHDRHSSFARNRFVGSLSGRDKWPAFSRQRSLLSGPGGESDTKLEDSWTGLATVVLN